MSSRPIRAVPLALALALCASCSKNDQGGRSDVRESASPSTPPDVSPTAAPGVAFNYGYEFSLPDERIAATQEAHASACEKLGLGGCRITGMSYTVDQDDQVVAELELKLDPLIARQFGKAAQQTVEGNDGKLLRLDIGSSDEGAKIEAASKQKGENATQISTLQQELGKARPGTQARANLLNQIQALEQQAAGQAQAIDTSRAVLVATPMTFHYYGRGGIPGFRGNPLRSAYKTFVTTFVWLADILLQALAVLIPLCLVLGAFITAWRTRPVRAIRAWIRGPQESEA